MRDIAFEEAQRCIVMGLVANVEGGNIPPGHKLDLSGLCDLVVVDRVYLMTHTAEVLGMCARMEEQPRE